MRVSCIVEEESAMDFMAENPLPGQPLLDWGFELTKSPHGRNIYVNTYPFWWFSVVFDVRQPDWVQFYVGFKPGQNYISGEKDVASDVALREIAAVLASLRSYGTERVPREEASKWLETNGFSQRES